MLFLYNGLRLIRSRKKNNLYILPFPLRLFMPFWLSRMNRLFLYNGLLSSVPLERECRLGYPERPGYFPTTAQEIGLC